MTSVEADRPDGRSLRKSRNVDSVLDAVHLLFVELGRVPTVEEVAARAGVSLRSVYRYFPERQQLMLAAVARRAELVSPYWELAEAAQGTLPDRVRRLADHVLTLYDVVADTARVALLLQRELPLLAQEIANRRLKLRSTIAEAFAPELSRLDPPAAEDLLATIESLVQFSSVDLLRREYAYPRERAAGVLSRTLLGVLADVVPAGPAA